MFIYFLSFFLITFHPSYAMLNTLPTDSQNLHLEVANHYKENIKLENTLAFKEKTNLDAVSDDEILSTLNLKGKSLFEIYKECSEDIPENLAIKLIKKSSELNLKDNNICERDKTILQKINKLNVDADTNESEVEDKIASLYQSTQFYQNKLKENKHALTIQKAIKKKLSTIKSEAPININNNLELDELDEETLKSLFTKTKENKTIKKKFTINVQTKAKIKYFIDNLKKIINSFEQEYTNNLCNGVISFSENSNEAFKYINQNTQNLENKENELKKLFDTIEKQFKEKKYEYCKRLLIKAKKRVVALKNTEGYLKTNGTINEKSIFDRLQNSIVIIDNYFKDPVKEQEKINKRKKEKQKLLHDKYDTLFNLYRKFNIDSIEIIHKIENNFLHINIMTDYKELEKNLKKLEQEINTKIQFQIIGISNNIRKKNKNISKENSLIKAIEEFNKNNSNYIKENFKEKILTNFTQQ